MPDALLIVLGILLATIVAVLVVLFIRFGQTPAALWARRVNEAVYKQNARLNSARSALAHLNSDSEARALRKEFLDRHFAGVAVEELIRFPGIGPATTSRVREAGLTNLSALLRADFSIIPGIGPARGKELLLAIRQLRIESESRFDAGACQEAVGFQEELKRREVDRQIRRRKLEHEIRMAERAIAAIDEQIRVARNVTFFNYLRRRKPPELTDELMNRTLVIPDEPLPEPPPAAASISKPVAPLQPVPVEVTPLERLQVVAGFGYAVAKADGRVAASERKQIRAFLERRYARGPELGGKLDALIAGIEQDVPALHESLNKVKRAIPSDTWPELYQFAVSVADAAGERNTREIECLARVAEELGIGGVAALPGTAAVSAARTVDPGVNVRAAETAAVPGRSVSAFNEIECRTILEISPNTPLAVDLIRRQYRLLTDRFAPERFASHGPDFAKMAADKRLLVERAARHLLAEYNEPLEPPAVAPPTDLRHNPDLDDVFGA